MKTNSGFVAAILALCAVSSVQEVKAASIKADHVREMHKAITPLAAEIIGELCGEADESKTSVTLSSKDQRYLDASLHLATPDEKTLLTVIYESQRRAIEITDEGITFHPFGRKPFKSEPQSV